MKKNLVIKEEIKNKNDNKDDLRYACPYCNEEFTTLEVMGPHIASHI